MSENEEPKFYPAKGSVIGGYSPDKLGRITDALQDVRLAIQGLALQFGKTGTGQGAEWTTAIASFARVCSIFLRKTVLGDFGVRTTRLLDDDVLNRLSFRFHRLVTIPRKLRNQFKIEFGCVQSGEMNITKLNDDTGEPEKMFIVPMGPQTLEIVVEWPLPGTLGWIGEPTEQKPWRVEPEMLFRLDEAATMNCDEWLSQQVVRFDKHGITLKEIIQTVVNFEAAHSVNTSRLASIEGEAPNKAARNPAPHIMNAIAFCGIRFAHLIVIESAIYLYDALLKSESITRPKGENYRLALAVGLNQKEIDDTETPSWVEFLGTMMIAFNNAPSVIRHEIRPVGRG